MELCYGNPGSEYRYSQARREGRGCGRGGIKPGVQATGQEDPGSCLPNSLLKRPPSTTGQSCQKHHCTVSSREGCKAQRAYLSRHRDAHLSRHSFMEGQFHKWEHCRLFTRVLRDTGRPCGKSSLRTGAMTGFREALASCHTSNRPHLHQASPSHGPFTYKSRNEIWLAAPNLEPCSSSKWSFSSTSFLTSFKTHDEFWEAAMLIV